MKGLGRAGMKNLLIRVAAVASATARHFSKVPKPFSKQRAAPDERMT